MQPLVRKAAAAAASIRALGTAGPRSRVLRPASFQAVSVSGARTTATPLNPRRQARNFSSDPSTTATANSSSGAEGAERGKEKGKEEKKGEKEGEGEKKKKSEPLRVLFCGSDGFSCAALEALQRERGRDPALIESIDVVVRPGKRAGRGNKNVVYPPIRDLAMSLGLPIHERDTFTGWDMPPRTNIIIAVSFGLFVPPRLLRQARFGGLNVHPSLLPDLRGPAPLHHALLAGRASTGVTLQTLDPEHFDRGKILARTPALRIPPERDYGSLLAMVTPVAAELLVRGLREGVHVPPLKEVEVEVGEGEGRIESPPLLHAPKITKADRQVLPHRLPELLRRFRVLGPLWLWSRDRDGVRKRVIFERISGTDPLPTPSNALALHSLLLEQDPTPSPSPSPSPDASSDTGADAIDSAVEKERAQPETTRLAVWVPKDKDLDEAVYIGSHRIETAKVEGMEAKPAKRALKNFLVPVEEQREELKKAVSAFILS